jgi:hypothetical protein
MARRDEIGSYRCRCRRRCQTETRDIRKQIRQTRRNQDEEAREQGTTVLGTNSSRTTMAQGTPRRVEKQKKANKKAQNTRKGKRVIPPKKALAIRQRQATKVRRTGDDLDRCSQPTQDLSAKMTRSIEQQAAAAASTGKLTIMRHAALNSKGQRVSVDS